MTTSERYIKKYGNPENRKEVAKHMGMFVMPEDIQEQIHCLPSKIYMHRKMMSAFEGALRLVIVRDLGYMIKSWDGCFNIRNIRGGDSWSIHSWGLAFDINAKENPLGKQPQMKPELVVCFTTFGFTWGGTFRRKDGMHFQLSNA